MPPEDKSFKALFLFRLYQNSLKTFLQLNQKHGDLFFKNMSNVDYYFISNPTWSDHILNKNDGNYKKHNMLINSVIDIAGDDNLFVTNDKVKWKHDRQIIEPSFSNDVYMDQYIASIQDVCLTYYNDWNQQLSHSNRLLINLTTTLPNLVIDIINNTLFYKLDIDTETVSTKSTEFFLLNRDKVNMPKLLWLLSFKKRAKFHAIKDLVEKATIKCISSRLDMKKDFDDILGTLLHDYDVNNVTSKNYKLVSNQLVTMLIAGYFNTAGAVQWALTVLGQHPDIIMNIRDEVNQICGTDQITKKSLAKLSYTRAFVSEVLRMHPPTLYILRESINTDNIDNCEINPNSTMWINVFNIHRHPDYWDEPNKFNVDRFLKIQNMDAIKKAYIPFGGGSRQCIARHFAFTEICLIISMFCQRYHIILDPKQKIDINYSSPFTMRSSVNKFSIVRN